MTALLLLLLSSSSSSSAAPPPRDVTSILGVNTHSGTSAAVRTPDGELDLIQAAGIAWIRDDIPWALVEPERGRYDFAATDGLFHALAARKLGFIAILGDLNTQWTAGGAGPHLTNATTIAAFARFAAAVATRYSRDNPQLLLELINEPNTMGGYANASLYAEVATAAGGAIHAAGGKVAAPACANADPDWLRQVFDGGLLEVTDTLTLHPYRATAPETAMATYDTVRELVSRYSPITRRVQIAQGEVGYGQGGASADPISPTQKAKLAVRMFLTSIASGVYPAIWYDWKQPHTECANASYTGECMGLIDDAQPPVLQPAYHAVQTLYRNLQGLHFVASPPTCQSDPCVVSDDDYALTFENATHIGVVVWSVLPFKHNIQLLFAAGCFSVMEWLGTPLPEICSSHTHQQHLNVYVTDSPLYLSQRLKSDDGDAASFFSTAPAPVQQPEPRAFEPVPPPTAGALKVDDTGTNSDAARPPPAWCGLPQWQSSWSMAGSLYAYCIGQCAIKWLANHTEHGRFAGVVGIDHYWTHQGMPCIDGQPREFAMQDELAKSIKTSNPGTRVLEYRIDDAVSYDPVVHNKMPSDPAAVVRWHHKPHNNGSICENWDGGAFIDPTRINNPKNNCSFHISSSAALDYTQPAVRTWYLDNIIKPTMKVGDGAWLDGDGPDTGAWMCTAGTHGNLRNKSKNGYTKISALNDSEAQAYATAKILVTSQAREWLLAHKGFEHTCFDFVSNAGQLPVVGDIASVCSSKLRALNLSRDWPSSGGGSYRPATVYYGSRVGDCGCYDSATVDQAAAVFMLTRHQHDLFHLPHNMSLTDAEARALLRDDGAPLGRMQEPTIGVFERRFEKATVRLDCANFTARFLSVAEHGAAPPQKLDDDKGSIHKGVAAAAAAAREKGTARISLGPLLADGMVFPSGNGTAAGDGVAASALVIVNFTRAGSTVIARGNADARGSWAIHLQISPSLTPGSMTVTSGNDSLDLRDVLIGALILCSGQSNMVFPLAAISCDRNADPSMASLGCQPVWSNGTAAVNASVTYTPRIRLATTTVTPAPGKFLSKPWAPASPSTVGTFSAECYLSATRLADQRPNIPLGLVQSARSGSPVQYWMSNESLVACPVANTHRYIYAEQRLGWLGAIHPMANVQFAAVLWHQGEANSFEPEIYSCLFKNMIASWRQLFRNPTLPFVFVQLQPCSISLEHRLAQAEALTLPGVGMATAIDLGDRGVGNGAYGECHSRYKEAVAVRAALELRRLIYGDKVSSEGPVLAKVSTERRVAKDRHSPTGESTSFVTVLTFTNAAGMHLGPTVDSLIGCGLPASQEVFMMQSTPTEQTGGSAAGEGRPWLDISVSARNGSLMPNIVVGGDVATLTLGQAGVPSFVSGHRGGPKFQAVALRYAWQDFPDCVLRNSDGFPAVPFQVSLHNNVAEAVHSSSTSSEDVLRTPRMAALKTDVFVFALPALFLDMVGAGLNQQKTDDLRVASPRRSISWWWSGMHVNASDPSVQQLLDFCKTRKNIVTTVMMRCGLLTCCRHGAPADCDNPAEQAGQRSSCTNNGGVGGTISGRLSAGCKHAIPQLVQMGIRPEIWLGEDDSISSARYLMSHTNATVAKLLSVAEANPGTTGFQIDLETKAKITTADDAHFQTFLRDVTATLPNRPTPLRFSADVGCNSPGEGGGPLGSRCKLRSSSGVDKLMDMATYFASDYSEWFENLHGAVATVPLDVLMVGLIADPFVDARRNGNHSWTLTPQSAQDRICAAMNLSVQEIAMFDLRTTGPAPLAPEPFWIKPLEIFIGGGRCDAKITAPRVCPNASRTGTGPATAWSRANDGSPWIPHGFTGCCEANGQRGAGWPICSESCARAECDATSGMIWVLQNFSKHPYLCCRPSSKTDVASADAGAMHRTFCRTAV